MSWIQFAFGHFVGYVVGFCYVLTYLLDISLYPVMFMAYMNEAVGYEMNFYASWGIGIGMLNFYCHCFVGLVVLLTIVNLIGINIVGFVR